MERIEPEAVWLCGPGFADDLVGYEPSQAFEATGTLVGGHDVGEVAVLATDLVEAMDPKARLRPSRFVGRTANGMPLSVRIVCSQYGTGARRASRKATAVGRPAFSCWAANANFVIRSMATNG